MTDQVMIHGDLARSVARMPDEFAIDFLRGYHDIMCGCGNSQQDGWWQHILNSIRAVAALEEQRPSTVPSTPWWRRITLR